MAAFYIIPFLFLIIFLNGKMEKYIPGMRSEEQNTIRLFLCGDVMTGRGVDQILPNPGDPEIHESYMKSALGYVKLAENENGKIPYPVDPLYIWGEAIHYWHEFDPDIKIINLETSITSYGEPWPNKAVNYRMHPDNIACLVDAGINYCALANNHLLDYGRKGMEQTLHALGEADIAFSGCGTSLEEARRPAVFPLGEKGRILIFSVGLVTSGIPHEWSADNERGGVYLPMTNGEILNYLKSYLESNRKERDVVVVSIHWGSNWGYTISSSQRQLARRLIDEAGVDVIHGHSSHHFKGIEVYRNKPVIYGAGDFINDYEGIGGHESYRGDLTLMYFLDMNIVDNKLRKLSLIPLRIRKMQLQKASGNEMKWIERILDREGRNLNTQFSIRNGYRIDLIDPRNK
jgi:poly-gamma-glutamate synthesis protein (capsule biosynthesis protein)